MDFDKVKDKLKVMCEMLQETKTLYELSEAEQIILQQFIMQLPHMGMSAKLAPKIFKAAAHFIESTDKLSKEIVESIISE